MNKQKKRIKRIVNLINENTPSHYPILYVKIYSTIYSMLRSLGNYQEQAEQYDKYYKERGGINKTYTKTKYYNQGKLKHRRPSLNIKAIAGNPVLINLENTRDCSFNDLLFLFLHELGHNYYERYNSEKMYDEKLADKFAIRWFKRIKSLKDSPTIRSY